MRILADENLESEIVEALRKVGHSVSDIKEMTPGVGDPDVLTMANEGSAILITNDKDFGELVFKERLFSSGVVLLRFGRLEIQEKIDFLVGVLADHSEELHWAFTVITPTGVRIRR